MGLQQKTINFFLSKGLSLASLRSLTKVARSQAKLAASYGGSVARWDYRMIPAKLFSNEQTPLIRQRRIFAVRLLFNFNSLKDSVNSLNRLENLKKRTHKQRVIETLSLWYLAYQLTVADSAFLEKDAILSFTASANLIRGYNRGLVTFGHCIYCGNPVLLKVAKIYTKKMRYKPDFFRCPWCNKKDSKLKIALEQQLYASEAWKKGQLRVVRTRNRKPS